MESMERKRKSKRIMMKAKQEKKSLSIPSTSIFLVQEAADDVLMEIFARLPECASAIRCGAVCKRWRSVISSPQFARSFEEFHRQRAYTLLINLTATLPPFQIFFSKESELMHRSRPRWMISHYLGFLPNIRSNEDVDILASFEDLVLFVHMSDERYRLYMANPLTRDWSQLPRIHWDGATYSETQWAMVRRRDDFRVVLVDMQRLLVKMLTLSTWEWTPHWIPPISDVRQERSRYRRLIHVAHCPTVVSCSGMLYWLNYSNGDADHEELEYIVGLDPFDDQCSCYVFKPPSGLITSDSLHTEICLGAFGDHVRMSQFCVAPSEGRWLLRVWELKEDDDGDDGRQSQSQRHRRRLNQVSGNRWRLVGKARLSSRGQSEWGVVGFHPHNPLIVLLYCDQAVYEVVLGDDDDVCMPKEVLHFSKTVERTDCTRYYYHSVPPLITLLHPPWPTLVSSLSRTSLVC